MGVIADDLDGDGRLDLFHTNFINQSSVVRHDSEKLAEEIVHLINRRARPLFWALDNFKASQTANARGGDPNWRLLEITARLPASARRGDCGLAMACAACSSTTSATSPTSR